jgi:hypothetical protein
MKKLVDMILSKFGYEEKPKVTGKLELKIYDNGQLIESFEEKNLVVYNGSVCMAKLLSGVTTNAYPTKIGIGTNGNDPVVGDTTLVSGFTKALACSSFPFPNKCQFTFSILESEAVGKQVREFALLTANNTMFARRNRVVIEKTNTIRLEGTWTITF